MDCYIFNQNKEDIKKTRHNTNQINQFITQAVNNYPNTHTLNYIQNQSITRTITTNTLNYILNQSILILFS